ncbi:unnamed protein product [Cuscuta epithymum]|uniref:Uncharacterized protein n=1 Tax=Cuscuta epithymum TaxID=186058 RepID=A0AAV0CWB7_9ASTE|nr:unnamed protein product [Cuscuta epithymum]
MKKGVQDLNIQIYNVDGRNYRLQPRILKCPTLTLTVAMKEVMVIEVCFAIALPMENTNQVVVFSLRTWIWDLFVPFIFYLRKVFKFFFYTAEGKPPKSVG